MIVLSFEQAVCREILSLGGLVFKTERFLREFPRKSHDPPRGFCLT